MASQKLPDKIAQYYYSYGLLCSSHPIFAITVAVSFLLICCSPLLNLPLPGGIPVKVSLPFKYEDNSTPFTGIFSTVMSCVENQSKNETENPSQTTYDFDELNSQSNLSVLMQEMDDLPYLWSKDEPLAYVQQIIIKTGVWPWKEELKLSDAFRAPIQEVFKLLEIIRNHQSKEMGISLSHMCFHVENVKRNVIKHKLLPVLPEYSCLVLSPANLWQQNVEKFLLDSSILTTIFNHQNCEKGQVSVADMVFGIPLKETGIKKYLYKAKPRTLQFAVSLFFHQLNYEYIDSLKEKLMSLYPLQYKWKKNNFSNKVMLIYYPGEFNYHEFIPLCVAFIGLFIYMYFSFRKLEFVTSKLGLSFSAVISVAASLVMTIGVCFFFGLTLSFQGKEIFPYLVILVGVENIFVITKSVMSIDSKLDVKIRLAQGLSKEGWSITKNLLVEITILTLCLFTFIPIVQHICIFMIVSLLCDFCLQMLFFSTVLGIDIRRNEELYGTSSEFQITRMGGKDFFSPNQGKFFIQDFTGFSKSSTQKNFNTNSASSKIVRSKSHPRLNGLAYQVHANVVANCHPDSNHLERKSDKKTPKRIMLVKIWARTRFFQRAFMVWMVIWISMIVYDSGIVENIYELANIMRKPKDVDVPGDNYIKDSNAKFTPNSIEIENHENLKDNFTTLHDNLLVPKSNYSPPLEIDHILKESVTINESIVGTNMGNLKLHEENLNKPLYLTSFKPWIRQSEFHWSSIFAQYNVSVSGKYLVILPPIMLKHRVTPEKALMVRHPAEKEVLTPISGWQTLAAALDPVDMMDFELDDDVYVSAIQTQKNWIFSQSSNDIPYYPASPMEFLFISILCLISILVITYTMVVVYRCVCTKNYAEWRSSWAATKIENQMKKPALQFVMEAVPTVVPGHNYDIECLSTNGEKIISCCLQGQVRVWNALNGELQTNIDRHIFFGLQNDMHQKLKIHKFTKIDRHHSESSDSSYNDNNSIQKSSIRKRMKTQVPNKLVNDKCELKMKFEKSNISSSNEHVEFANESLNISANSVPSSIWCMDFIDDLIVLGCSNGHLEFWEASTGKFKCIYYDENENSVNFVKFMEGILSCGTHLIVTRLSGYLDLFLLETSHFVEQKYKKTHVRTGSAGSISFKDGYTHYRSESDVKKFFEESDKENGNLLYNTELSTGFGETLRCRKLASVRAHQQPITGLECDGGKIITGSQDHTLKVFSSYDLSALYTLHGHCGPITCLFIDRFCPTVSGSGSEDGLLCVWDLMTGACVYSIQAHDGPITELAYSESYVISMGADEKLCIWDRFRGHLLNLMHTEQGAGNCGMLSLTHSLVITGGKGGLTVWNASTGQAIRKVILGPNDSCAFVKRILPIQDGIICEFGNELRIVRFPVVSHVDNDYERKND